MRKNGTPWGPKTGPKVRLAMAPAILKSPTSRSVRDVIEQHVRLGTYDAFVAKICADPCVWAERIFRPINDPYKDRPFLWRGHDDQHPGQANIFEAIFRYLYRFLVVGTGHGIGKTFLVKLIPVFWLITHYNGIVILSAASWEALHQDIIPGLRAMMLSAAWPLFPLPKAESLSWGNEWYVAAISPLHPESAQGKHARGGVLVLVDEASHLDPIIFNALLSNCTGEKDCMVLLGNPLRADGPFADIILGRIGVGAEDCTVTREDGTKITITMNRWHRMNISSLESPNLRAGKEIYPGLIGPSGLAGFIERYGLNTPEYQARVLGVVPDQDANVYISRSSLELCGRRPTIPWQEDTNLVLGVDVARSEVGDQTGFGVRGDHTFHHLEMHRGMDETAVLRRILEIREKYTSNPSKHSPEHCTLLDELSALEADEKVTDARKRTRVDDLINRLHIAVNEDRSSDISASNVHVDGGGLGSGLCDRMERLGYPPSVRIISSATADDAQGCANRRAECWKNMKKVLETLAIPPEILKLLMGIATLRYKYDVKQRLLIESKDDYKKRNERSPDETDTAVYTCYHEPGASAFSAATQCHALRRAPTIRHGLETSATRRERARAGAKQARSISFLHLDGLPIEDDRPGVLCRASWLARREKSACLWLHVDSDGYWIVFDALSAENVLTRVFWERVLDKSLGHRYLYDVFSCPEGTERQGELSLEDELWEITHKGKHHSKSVPQHSTLSTQHSSVPRFVPMSHISGTAGLDVLDSRLLATLSWYPSNVYWREHNLDPITFRSPKGVGIWPTEVLESLSRARLTEHGWKDETLTEDPESLVAQGGPLIRCLRLLAISGAGQ